MSLLSFFKFASRTSKELRGQVLSHGKFGVFVAVKPSEEANVTVGLLPKVGNPQAATVNWLHFFLGSVGKIGPKRWLIRETLHFRVWDVGDGKIMNNSRPRLLWNGLGSWSSWSLGKNLKVAKITRKKAANHIRKCFLSWGFWEDGKWFWVMWCAWDSGLLCLFIPTMVNFWSCCHVEAGELRYSILLTKEDREHLCPYQFSQLRFLLLLGSKPFAHPFPCARCSSADLSWNDTGGFGLETAWFASSCKDGGWHGSPLAFTWRLSWYSHHLTWIHTQIFLTIMVWRRHSCAIWGVGPIKVSCCDVLDCNSQTKRKKGGWKIANTVALQWTSAQLTTNTRRVKAKTDNILGN